MPVLSSSPPKEKKEKERKKERKKNSIDTIHLKKRNDINVIIYINNIVVV